jgi:hypothetical protein
LYPFVPSPAGGGGLGWGIMRPNRAEMLGETPRRLGASSAREMTDVEQALWRELRKHGLGWRFRRQFPMLP